MSKIVKVTSDQSGSAQHNTDSKGSGYLPCRQIRLLGSVLTGKLIVNLIGTLTIMSLIATFAFGFNTASAGIPVEAIAHATDQNLPSLAPMLAKVTPAVVNISTLGRVKQENPLLRDPFFRRFFDVPQSAPRRTQSQGSGVIIDAAKGYILTNNHVIDKAAEIRVTLHDQRELTAKLIGTDPDTDIAVIQVAPVNLTDVPLADSDSLRVGDFVVAIGNPFGLGQTVTSGIVSALGRSGLGIEGYEDFIQTDASINPGNSGGALVNLRGELVGINTAIFSPGRAGNVGIGFAIPVNMANEIKAQLVQFGEVTRGRLGISIQNLSPDLAKAFNIKADQKGAVIARIEETSPADQAGLKPGDVIVSVNERNVRDASDLRNMIGLLRVGQRIKLVAIRNGEKLDISAEITAVNKEKIEGKVISKLFDGATLSIIDVAIRSGERVGKRKAIRVTAVESGSPADQAGLREGDIFKSVNRRDVHSFKELKNAVNRTSRGVLLNIQRGSGAIFLLIQ